METETVETKIVRYIDDAIALEAASITALANMAKDAVTTDERLLYQEHLTESEAHKQRLEGRMITLGGASQRSMLKDVMNSVGAAATNLLHTGRNDGEKDTRNLLQAYAMESLEISVYEALHAAANSIGDIETATIAREIQGEERAMAKHVFARIADSSILSVGAAA